jgi:hypothetical protein
MAHWSHGFAYAGGSVTVGSLLRCAATGWDPPIVFAWFSFVRTASVMGARGIGAPMGGSTPVNFRLWAHGRRRGRPDEGR